MRILALYLAETAQNYILLVTFTAIPTPDLIVGDEAFGRPCLTRAALFVFSVRTSQKCMFARVTLFPRQSTTYRHYGS